MFPRQKRLSREEFPTVMKAGRRLSSLNFTATFSPETTGYAVVVSKKIVRLSVTRHRIKRRVLAILRTLTLPPSLIIFPKSSANSVSYTDMRAEIENLLFKIKK